MPCSDNIITLKTGSAAFFAMIYRDAAEAPIDLTGYQIDMDFVEAKTGKLLKHTSTVTGEIILISGVTGEYTVDAGDTTDWQLGEMPVDIKYTAIGRSQHTEDFILNMVRGRTA